MELCKSGNFSSWWVLLKTPAVSWGQWKWTIRAQQSCAADRSAETHLTTHTQHNLAVHSSPAFLCCHRDHISAPFSFPDQAPGFQKHEEGEKREILLFLGFCPPPIFYTPGVCGQRPYSLGWKFRTDHNIHWYRGIDVAAFPFSKTKDDQVFGKWKRNVDLKTLSVGFAADKTRLSRCVDLKFSVSALPDELTRDITHRPQHVKAQLPHVVYQEDGAWASPALSTHLLLANLSGAPEQATQFIN